MVIQVKLFAILKDRGGMSELSLDVAGETTVERAIVQLAEKLPAIREYLPRVAVAVNREYVKRDHVLRDGDELALIPPVSGG
jgi:molybdopterin converting factor subunit 1